MLRRKIKRKSSISPSVLKLNAGSVSFIAILIVAAIGSLFSLGTEYQQLTLLLIGLFGSIIAIDNITKNEEMMFMISAITIIIVGLALTSFITLPEEMRLFIAHLSVAFGIGGFIVALGAILKLGWTR